MGNQQGLTARTARLDTQVAVDRLPPVTAAGVSLIKIVLGMVMGSIVVLAAYLLSADIIEGTAISHASEAMLRQAGGTADQLRQLADLTKQLSDQRAAFRAFWLQMAQMILLNLLLPVLTALLGYIFGTTQIARQREEE